MFWFPDRCNT